MSICTGATMRPFFRFLSPAAQAVALGFAALAPASVFALGAELITPVSVTSLTATGADNYEPDLLSASQLIDGSGLSATPDIDTFSTVTHTQAFGNTNWVTGVRIPFQSDFYADAAPVPLPELTFTFDAVYEFTDMVVWGYFINNGGNLIAQDNEARAFDIEFSTDNGATYSDPVRIRSTRVAGENAVRVSFAPAFANAVRLTVVDNHAGVTDSGGDRVGLGEVRFIAHPIPESESTDFGEVDTDDSYVERRFVIKNTFDSPVSTGAPPHASITGSGAQHFEIVQDFASSILPNDYTYCVVRFNPTFTGVHQALLELPSGLGDDILLTGEGRNPSTEVLNDFNRLYNFAGEVNTDVRLAGTLPDGNNAGTFMNLIGDTTINGDLFIESGTIWMNGHRLTVNGSVYFDAYSPFDGGVQAVVEMESGSVLNIQQNLIHRGGSIQVDSNGLTQLRIGGDYVAAPSVTGHKLIEEADLSGTGPGGTLFWTVEGNFIVDDAGHFDWDPIGVLEVRRNFTLTSSLGTPNFTAGAVTFTGDFDQTVTLEIPDVEDRLTFEEIRLRNPMVQFAQQFPTINSLSKEGSQRLSTVPGLPIEFTILFPPTGSLACINGDASDLPSTLSLTGVVGNGVQFQFSGDLIQNHSPYNAGSFNDPQTGARLPARLEIAGDFEQRFDIIAGGFSEDTYLLVEGDAVFDAAVAPDLLAFPHVCEFRGDVTQLGTLEEDGLDTFVFSPHTVIFSGTGPQIVSFENPVANGFQSISVQNPELRFAQIPHFLGIPDPNAIQEIHTLEGNEIEVHELYLDGTSKLIVNGDLVIKDLGDDREKTLTLISESELLVKGSLTQQGSSLRLQGSQNRVTIEGNWTQNLDAGITHLTNPDNVIEVFGAALLTAKTFPTDGRYIFHHHFTEQSNLNGVDFSGPLDRARVSFVGTGIQFIEAANPGINRPAEIEILNENVQFASIFNLENLTESSITELRTTTGGNFTMEGDWGLPEGISFTVDGNLNMAANAEGLVRNGCFMHVTGDMTFEPDALDFQIGGAELLVDGDFIQESSNFIGVFGIDENRATLRVLGNFYQMVDSNDDGSFDGFSTGILDIGDNSRLILSKDGYFNSLAISNSANSYVELSGDEQQDFHVEDLGSSNISTLIVSNLSGMRFLNPVTIERLLDHGGFPVRLHFAQTYKNFPDFDGDFIYDHLDPRPKVAEAPDFTGYTSFFDWAEAHAMFEGQGNETTIDELITTYTDEFSDPDGDGSATGLEFYLGESPAIANGQAIKAIIYDDPDDGERYAGVEVEVSKAAEAENQFFPALSISDNLGTFTEVQRRVVEKSQTSTHRTLLFLDPTPLGDRDVFLQFSLLLPE